MGQSFKNGPNKAVLNKFDLVHSDPYMQYETCYIINITLWLYYVISHPVFILNFWQSDGFNMKIEFLNKR